MKRYTDEYWDHLRDLRKHDFPSLKPVATAVEIAALVKQLPNITDAANLIEQYAQTVAAGARLEGIEQAYARVDAMLGPKVPA